MTPALSLRIRPVLLYWPPDLPSMAQDWCGISLFQEAHRGPWHAPVFWYNFHALTLFLSRCVYVCLLRPCLSF
jgi:hypothetical protein